MFKLRRFLKPYTVQVVFGSTAKLIEVVFELMLPLLMANIVDVGLANQDRPYIIRTGVLMLVYSLLGLGFALYSQYSASVASQGSGTLIRNSLIEKISTYSYNELDRFGTPTLINRVTNDVNQIQQAVAMMIRLVTRAPFLCGGALVMSFFIDRRLALVFLVLLPVFTFILYLIITKSAPLYKAAQKKLDGLSLVLRENLSGVRVIRAFSRQNKEKKRIEKTTDDLSKAYIRVSNLSALMNPATSVIMNIGILVILYAGGYRVNDGYLTQGQILALINYITQTLLALIIVANLVVLFTKASASAARINEILETDATINDAENPSTLPESSDFAVEFQDVSFSYGENEKAVSHISFKLAKGETLGIVGTTGSGKTTLLNLIPRFYDVDSGAVLVNGRNVREVMQEDLRARIGIVPQKSVLFSGSIAYNMRWGKSDATEEEINSALKTAQCYEFVHALDEGIHAEITEGGKNFSGGQKQRLAIARALVKKPDILILDDSLSALDYKTDLDLREAIKTDLPHTTKIISSQRLSSVAAANTIIVLDDGEMVGAGTHDSLLKTCGTYKEIYDSQNS